MKATCYHLQTNIFLQLISQLKTVPTSVMLRTSARNISSVRNNSSCTTSTCLMGLASAPGGRVCHIDLRAKSSYFRRCGAVRTQLKTRATATALPATDLYTGLNEKLPMDECTETLTPRIHLPMREVTIGVDAAPGVHGGEMEDRSCAGAAFGAFVADTHRQTLNADTSSPNAAGDLVAGPLDSACDMDSQDPSQASPVPLHELPCSFVGIYDGHNGVRSAERACKRFHEYLADSPALWAAFEPTALVPGVTEAEAQAAAAGVGAAFLRLQRRSAVVAARTGDDSCVTAVVGLQVGLKLITAHAGNCRAVLCRGGQPYELARDHQPAVTPTTPTHVHVGVGDAGVPQAGPELMGLKRGMVALPAVRVTTLQPGQDQFVLYASSGLWEAVSSEDAIQHVLYVLREYREQRPTMPPEQGVQEACKQLVQLARMRGATGDVTAIITHLNWVAHSRATQPRKHGPSSRALRHLQLCGSTQTYIPRD